MAFYDWQRGVAAPTGFSKSVIRGNDGDLKRRHIPVMAEGNPAGRCSYQAMEHSPKQALPHPNHRVPFLAHLV